MVLRKGHTVTARLWVIPYRDDTPDCCRQHSTKPNTWRGPVTSKAFRLGRTRHILVLSKNRERSWLTSVNDSLIREQTTYAIPSLAISLSST